MEARKTHQRHMAGVAVSSLIHPSNGLRDDILRSGGKPKDHSKEYKQNLKKLQQENRKKKQEAELHAQSPTFKLKRFENVSSRVETRRSNSDSTLSVSGSPSPANSPNTPRKNFIQLNAIKVKRISSQNVSLASTPVQPPPKPKTRPGQLPHYLVERKLEWAKQEEERLQNMELEKIPKGMMLIPDNERIHTLNGLKFRHSKLLEDLAKFSVVLETESARARKAKVENELAEVEQGIDVFSKSRVFIKTHEYDSISSAN